MARLREDFPAVKFFECPNREDFGHEKRHQGLEQAKGVFVGFFNDDDNYTNDYLEKMLDLADTADVVFCAWNEQPNCGFAHGSSTSGNFIVRTDLARKVGYGSREYDADGHFINALAAATKRVARIDDVLYFHNA